MAPLNHRSPRYQIIKCYLCSNTWDGNPRYGEISRPGRTVCTECWGGRGLPNYETSVMGTIFHPLNHLSVVNIPIRSHQMGYDISIIPAESSGEQTLLGELISEKDDLETGKTGVGQSTEEEGDYVSESPSDSSISGNEENRDVYKTVSNSASSEYSSEEDINSDIEAAPNGSRLRDIFYDILNTSVGNTTLMEDSTPVEIDDRPSVSRFGSQISGGLGSSTHPGGIVVVNNRDANSDGIHTGLLSNSFGSTAEYGLSTELGHHPREPNSVIQTQPSLPTNSVQMYSRFAMEADPIESNNSPEIISNETISPAEEIQRRSFSSQNTNRKYYSGLEIIKL